MSWSWGVPPPAPPWYEHILPTLNTSHTGSSVEFDGTKQMLGRKSSENLTFFFAILFLALVLFSMLFTVVNLCMCDRKGGEAAWLADLDQPKTERVSSGRCATHPAQLAHSRPSRFYCTQEAKVYKTILTENKTEQDRIHVKNVKPKSHSDLVRIKLSAKPKEDV